MRDRLSCPWDIRYAATDELIDNSRPNQSIVSRWRALLVNHRVDPNFSKYETSEKQVRQQLGLVGNNTAMTCRKCKKKKEQTTRAVIWIEQVVGNHLLMQREASCCVGPNENGNFGLLLSDAFDSGLCVVLSPGVWKWIKL